MDNYIVINGKRAELTPEQLKALGIETEVKSPFARVQRDELFYAIDPAGEIGKIVERNTKSDRVLFECANYCTDKEIMEQRALFETLSRLLWRYSMEHDGNKIAFNDGKAKWSIYCSAATKEFMVCRGCHSFDISTVYFATEEIAKNAIEEIVKPFMKAHPGFRI